MRLALGPEAFTADGDPNVIGELLRLLTFPEHDGGELVGCYTTFAVRPDATPLDPAARARLVALSLRGPAEIDQLADLEITSDDAAQVEEDNANAEGYVFAEGDLRIELAWFWDGDGWLVYRVFSPAGFVCGVVNDDAKKPHNWRAFHLPYRLEAAEPAVWGRCPGCLGARPEPHGEDHGPGELTITLARGAEAGSASLTLCGSCAERLLRREPVLVRALGLGAPIAAG